MGFIIKVQKSHPNPTVVAKINEKHVRISRHITVVKTAFFQLTNGGYPIQNEFYASNITAL